ncbi:electron transport complex subunit RsxC [Shewanella sp. GXUN23E]|uniref:electron transport complex subunit RsxC n=1 Tax=Shewanella sp. GXUN23E TaxID=3422498 RepID=UPI003D7EB902
MLTNLEQLDNGVVWRIPGGIHPPQQKTLSNQTAIESLPLDEYYYLPVPQVGEQATLAVKVGQAVLKGQPLTHGVTLQHLPVHAPTSGTVTAIEPRPSNHPSGLPVLTCVIHADGLDSWTPLQPARLDELSDEQIIARVHSAGVAGMGGAAFPSHIKLSPASDIELVIINGVECEPYITSDDRLMREHAAEVISGMQIIYRLLSPQRMIIAIEDNKPEAIEAMSQALQQVQDAETLPKGVARVTVVPTKYPSGGEKQLIQLLTGKEVPSGAIPAQLGILVHNVGTAMAISDAVLKGQPLIERIVTVTGNSVAKRGNYRVPVGTRVDHILNACSFTPAPDQKVIIGGPMMGYTLPQLQVPILKGTNCVLVPDAAEMAMTVQERACIRCSECANACPASLLPQQLYWHAKSTDYDRAADYNLRDCIECGCCSYVCPSDIPLVEYFRVAKSALRNAAEEKLKSERAKLKFEAKQARLEEEKRQREAKAKEAAERRQASMSGNDKDAIAQAMARIQAKKAADNAAAQVASNPAEKQAPVDRKAQVADAVARAKARKAAQANGDSLSQPTSHTEPQELSQKDKVAAAIARAKAKKAAAAGNAGSTETDAPASASPVQHSASCQQDKVAAAIARAKAKKAALKAEQQEDSESEMNHAIQAAGTEPATAQQDPAEDKKARVAAAIAKAKAKKAADSAANSVSTDNQSTEVKQDAEPMSPAQDAKSSLSEDDVRKARVAAAIAKAKAKKAAQAQDKAALTTDINTTEAAPESEPTPESKLKPKSEHGCESAPVDADEAQKARVAAAIAKAKAKKAAQNQFSDSASGTGPKVEPEGEAKVDDAAVITTAVADAASDDSVPQVSADEAKKARVAAAIAKAKAKKAARDAEDKE